LQGIFRGWFRDPAFHARLDEATLETAAVVWSWSLFGTAQQWNQQLIPGTTEEVTERLARLLLQVVATSV
jgi:hypothetical protein